MAEGKNSFVLYRDQKEVFEALNDVQAGKLIKHIFRYVTDENPTTDDAIVGAVFIGIQQALKRDLKKWETKQEQRKRAGEESARKRKEAAKLLSKNKKNQRSLTTVDDRQHPSTVNVNDNDNDNVNVLSKESDTRAIDFLQKQCKSRFQQEFQMKYANKIENKEKFKADFNDKVDEEQLIYEPNILLPRLCRFARNWIENQDRFTKQEHSQIQTSTAPKRF